MVVIFGNWTVLNLSIADGLHLRCPSSTSRPSRDVAVVVCWPPDLWTRYYTTSVSLYTLLVRGCLLCLLLYSNINIEAEFEYDHIPTMLPIKCHFMGAEMPNSGHKQLGSYCLGIPIYIEKRTLYIDKRTQ